MAQMEMFTAAFVALIVTGLVAIFANLQSRKVTSRLSKVLCWVAPAAGFIIVPLVVLEALFGPSGGFRVIMYGLAVGVLYVLCIALAIAQLLFSFVARVVDRNQS